MEFAKLATTRIGEKKMKKLIALILALVMVMGLVACSVDNTEQPEERVIRVPSPDKITADYLLENAEWVGRHETEGDLYLLGSYLCAIRENGTVSCLAMNILKVESLDYHVGVIGGIPYTDQIRAMTIDGYMQSYCGEQIGWVRP